MSYAKIKIVKFLAVKRDTQKHVNTKGTMDTANFRNTVDLTIKNQ